MKLFLQHFILYLVILAIPAYSCSAEEGGIFNIWPLFDYRTSPATGYSNLSILGPLFKHEHSGNGTKTAVRPFFFNSTTPESDESDILYPIASTSTNGDSSYTQIFKMYQKRASRMGSDEEKQDTMLFPFYISGESEKHGPYKSFFPIYGNIYDRFWRDEYHYTLFPVYGRTVKKGTTTTNWLYPFFSTMSGENERGFQFWPVYGESSKEGVYSKRFVIWPFFTRESLGQNSEKPTENLYLLPFYASSKSPQISSTHAPWPFCGVVKDGKGDVLQRDFFWPFWTVAESGESFTRRYIPFYSESGSKERNTRWIIWPFYRHEKIDSPAFRQDKTSLLYFLFSRSDESWPESGKDRARSALWPLYAWKKDEEGTRTISAPAIAEAVIWNDGLERNWAPLWRMFIARWDDKGNNAVSLLWNLYWQERRGNELAWELSPLLSYSSTGKGSDFRLLKGLFGYTGEKNTTTLRFFWIPFKL